MWFCRKVEKHTTGVCACGSRRFNQAIVAQQCPFLTLQYNIYIYICMVITHSKSKDRTGKAANPAPGQLNWENEYFPVPVRA